MPHTGEGCRKVLVVAEAPGEEEDRRGVQLVGRSGRLLRRILRDIGVDLDRDCWKTNAVICHSKGPTRDEHVVCCRPNMLRAMKELEPHVVLLLGAAAVKSLVGHAWREGVGSIGRWVGWRIPSQEWNAWLCPTWHPAYLLRQDDDVLELWFRRHVRAAFSLQGRPWAEVPDYRGSVECLYSHREAAAAVREATGADLVAFDYETDRLKPDGSGATIVSCALSWRDRTVAFPWHGDVVGEMGRLLRSGVPKVAHNMKFEERWTRRALGHGVRNWRWDTMLAAHVADNRTGITSLKFLSFVLLGQASYDDAVRDSLEADGGRNRVRQAALDDLLVYNGMDARLTYEIAVRQMGVATESESV